MANIASESGKSDCGVLVIGAGELGTAVLEALCRHPLRNSTPISVLLRASSLTDPSPAKTDELRRLKAFGISIVGGDIEGSSQTELASLFAGYDTVISCTGMTGSAGLQVKLAQVAIKARVRRYVPWQFGVDYDAIGRGSAQNLFTEQLQVRDILRGQAELQWLIFSVGVFMSFVFEPAFGMIERDTDTDRTSVRAFGSWENQFTATTVEDIGAVVAEVIFSAGDDFWNGKNGEAKDGIVFVAGDTLTYADLANTMEKVIGGEVIRALWTVDTMKKRLGEDPENGLKKYGVVWAEGRGVAWGKAASFNAKREMKMTTVEDWAIAYF